MDSASDAITFTNPVSLAWHHLGLELVVYIGFALTVRHALGEYRRGNGFHAFQWVVIFIYGLIMELVSFNFIDNYVHATFTVQFYHGLLPLYITCIYVVFHYTGIKLVGLFTHHRYASVDSRAKRDTLINVHGSLGRKAEFIC